MKILAKLISYSVCIAILSLLFIIQPFVTYANTTSTNVSILEYNSILTLYKDKDMTLPYSRDNNIPEGSKVYYKISCDEGYFCYKFKVNATEVTSEYFVVHEPTIECTVYSTMLGDVTGRTNVLDLEDAVNLMRYIAGHNDVSTSVYWSAGGLKNYDFNRDGIINLTDVTAELKAIAKHKNAYPAVEYERDFEIAHIVTDIVMESYLSVDSFDTGNSDVVPYPYYETYSEKLISTKNDFTDYITRLNGENFDTTLNYNKETDAYESYSPLYESFNEDFFKKYNIDIKVGMCNSGTRIFVDRIWKEPDGQLTVMLSHEHSVGTDHTGSWMWVFFIKLPKEYEYQNIRLQYLTDDGRYVTLNDVPI